MSTATQPRAPSLLARTTDLCASLRSRLTAHWPVALLSLVLFAVYSVYALARQATYLTAGYDLGIFDQAVREYAHFRAPIVALKGADYNIFADHFHPIIALAAPLYWLFDSPSTLLVLQAGLIAASVPFVHAFARRRRGAGAALAIAAVYGTGWALQAMVDFDFHEVAWGVPILAATIDALDRRDDRTLLACAGLLMLVREDMGVILVVIGLLRLWQRPRRTALWLIGVGAVGYFLVTALVIPAFAPNGRFAYWTFDALGSDLPHALANILAHPVRTARLFVTPSVKAETLGFFLVPLALLPLRSRYALIALPLLAERFFNSRSQVWSTHYHYNALPWVVLVLAMIDGGGRLGVFSRRLPARVVIGYLVAVAVLMNVVPNPTPKVFRRMATGEAWRVSQHLRDQRAAVAQLPSGACVSVDDRLAAQLTNRDRVTLPGVSTPRTDFVALDLSQATVGFELPTPQVILAEVQAKGYLTIFRQGDLIVLRSPGYAGPTAGCRP